MTVPNVCSRSIIEALNVERREGVNVKHILGTALLRLGGRQRLQLQGGVLAETERGHIGTTEKLTEYRNQQTKEQAAPTMGNRNLACLSVLSLVRFSMCSFPLLLSDLEFCEMQMDGMGILRQIDDLHNSKHTREAGSQQRREGNGRVSRHQET
jgi:hypothetical protein